MTFERAGTDWEKQLLDSEKGVRKEGNRDINVVLLRGLQRLAQLAGIKSSDCYFTYIETNAGFGIMQAIYSAEFGDGTRWVGAADCNKHNTDGKFLNYPTAVAESRAEARCLRKALGISTLSSEEIGFTEGGAVSQIEASPDKRVDGQIVKAIESLCDSRGISIAEVLEAILDKSRNGSVFELSELTLKEGQKAMSWLNDQKASKPKEAKLTPTQQREARKKELQDKQ